MYEVYLSIVYRGGERAYDVRCQNWPLVWESITNHVTVRSHTNKPNGRNFRGIMNLIASAVSSAPSPVSHCTWV